MKKIKLLILVLIMSFPIMVDAHELVCDTTVSKNHGESFNCYIKLNELPMFDEISGTITSSNDVECKVFRYDSGLQNESQDESKFKLSGAPTKNQIIDFTCEVVGKPTEETTAQVMISDYKYHIFEDDKDAESLILRSSYIKLNKYEEELVIETEDDKPRDTSNNDSLLKTIQDDNLELSFSKFITKYEIEVLFEVEQLDLKVLPVNKNAIVKIEGNQKLEIGKNTIDIYVTSPDNKTTTCYSLYITRLARGEEIYYPKKDATLSNMTVTGYSIKFNKDIYEYHIHLDRNTSKVEVNPTTTYEDAIVDISKTNNLVNNDIITVTVTSADGTNIQKYKIRVTKDAPKKDYSLYITLGIIIIVFLVVAYLFLRTSKKEKNDPLLRLKTDKRKVNKGAKFDDSGVPILGEEEIKENLSNEQPQNIINEQSGVAEIITTNNVIDNNLNKVTPMQTNIDLNVQASAQPIPVTEEVKVENTVTSSLNSNTPVLDLNNTTVEQSLVNEDVETLDI